MQGSDKDMISEKKKLIQAARKWVKEKKSELEAKEEEIRVLSEDCEKIRREMLPLQTWLNEVGGGSKPKAAVRAKNGDEISEEKKLERSVTNENAEESKELRGDRLRDEVVKILDEVYPENIYYREILRKLEIKGFQISGKDPGLNLVAHLAKEPRAVRAEKRGMYCLNKEEIR